MQEPSTLQNQTPKSTVEALSSLLSSENLMPPKFQFIAHVPAATRFFQCRESFRSKSKPIHVSVGFHYTRSTTKRIVEKIAFQGLQMIGTNGAYFGRGIYLSENSQAFSYHGDVGILVLYVAGTTEQLFQPKEFCGRDVDTFRGNKLTRKGLIPNSSYFDEIIVTKNEQVLPVYAFPQAVSNDADQLYRLHVQVQELIDCTINYAEDYALGTDTNFVPRKTAVPRVYPSYDEDVKRESMLHTFRKKHSLNFGILESFQFRFLNDGTLVLNPGKAANK